MSNFSIRLELRPDKKWNSDLATIVSDMDSVCFPGEPISPVKFKATYWWIVRCKNKPIGYAGLRLVDEGDDKLGFLCRVGVLPDFRGHGLQKRLINSRVSFAKRVGCSAVLTYAYKENYPSINSLVSRGFRMYSPSYAWAGRDVMLYFRILFKNTKAT